MKGHAQSPVELAVRDELAWAVQSRPGRPRESGASMRTESKRKTVGAWWVTGWESRRMLKELESASRGLEWPHLSSTLKVWRPAQNWGSLRVCGRLGQDFLSHPAEVQA